MPRRELQRPESAPSRVRPPEYGSDEETYAHPWMVAGVALALLATTASFTPVAAQEFPNLAGLEARIGVANPVDADVGVSAGLEADLGFFERPGLRTLARLHYFRGNVDRPGTPGGSFDAYGLNAAARGDVARLGDVRPYVVGGVTGYNVTADLAEDPTLETALEGFYVGALLGAGVNLAIDEERRFGVTVEGRRTFANNIGHWAFEAGVRFNPRGMGTYQTTQEWRQEQRLQQRQRGLQERERLTQDARERREAREAERRRREQAREDPQARQPEQQEQEDPQARERERAEPRAGERAAADRRGAQRRAGESDLRLRRGLLDLERRLATAERVRETGQGLAVTLGPRLFEEGTFRLSRSGASDLQSVAELLQNHPDRSVLVRTFTAGEGNGRAAQEGRQFAQRRAETVRAALISEGLDPLQVEVATQDAADPAAELDREDRRGAPDRVEVIVRPARN